MLKSRQASETVKSRGCRRQFPGRHLLCYDGLARVVLLGAPRAPGLENTLRNPQNTRYFDLVNAPIADFEANRIQADELAEALRAVCESGAGEADLAADIRERVGQLAERVEMMHFSLCRAERRGAILDLLGDFIAEIDALLASDNL